MPARYRNQSRNKTISQCNRKTIDDCVNAVKWHSQRCGNPFCKALVNIKSPRGKHGRYCSPRCRMDGYALRRAKTLLNRVGVIRFHTLLDKL